MTPLEAAEEMRRLSGLIDKGLGAMRKSGNELDAAEEAYREARKAAWKHVDREATAEEKKDFVNGYTAPFRKVRDAANHDRQDALEAVRSRRTQVSALQTLINSHTEEAKFARTGPDS